MYQALWRWCTKGLKCWSGAKEKSNLHELTQRQKLQNQRPKSKTAEEARLAAEGEARSMFEKGARLRAEAEAKVKAAEEALMAGRNEASA